MYDPTLEDSPHLGGAQPTWGDLPYATEMLRYIWENPTESYSDAKETLVSAGKESKIAQMFTLLGEDKLRLINSSGILMPEGCWLANQYQPPDQRDLGGEGPTLGRKQDLSSGERGLWQTILFQRDWLPMLATVNQLLTSSVTRTETDKRATDFKNRVSHLKGYQDVQSINSWKKKAQAHFSWATHIDLAEEVERDRLKPTEFCIDLDDRFQDWYHQDWPK